jgi:hypothetical protein
LLARIPTPSTRGQILLPLVAGIVIGVLLIASGLALLQLAGAVAIGFALLLARGKVRIPGVLWSDPRGQLLGATRAVRQWTPDWAWQAIVAALIGLAAVYLISRLVTADDLGVGTLGDMAKGAIALAMMATLALWSMDEVPRRFPRWGKREGERETELSG